MALLVYNNQLSFVFKGLTQRNSLTTQTSLQSIHSSKRTKLNPRKKVHYLPENIIQNHRQATQTQEVVVPAPVEQEIVIPAPAETASDELPAFSQICLKVHFVEEDVDAHDIR